MSRGRRPVASGARAALLAACVAWSAVAGAAPLAGRPVQDVLRELAAGGVNFIYNNDLVPPGLLVLAEPVPGAPADVARQVLAAHGLALSAVGPDAFAIVRQPAAAAAAAGGEPAAGAPAEPPLAELVVTTSRYALAYSEPQAHSFLTQADVQSQPKLADEPLRSVQRLPGSAASGITAQTHLRGGEFDEVLMVLDGMPLAEPFHLRNFLAPVSLFDADAIQAMDVSSGGFSANFGDRMSGVIDITSLVPPDERYTELGLSLFHASALSAGRFASDRGEWLAAVRRSNLDVLANIVDSDVGKPSYFDAYGRVRYALSDATTVFGSVLSSRDTITANTTDQQENADADYDNTYAWGGWEQAWTDRFGSRLILGVTDLETTRDGTIEKPGEQSAAMQESRNTRMFVGRLDLDYTAPRVYTRAGLEGRLVDAKYHYRSTNTFEPGYPLPGDPGETVTRDLAPHPDGQQVAAWVTSRARLTDRLSAEAGLRWDDQTYDDVDGPDQFAPRLNLMYDLAPGTRLRAAWGRFWQAQGPNELQVEDGVATFYEPQNSDQLILSLEQSLPRDLELRVEVYRKDYDHVRPHYENLFDPVKLLPELEPDRVEVAPDGSLARGVEAMLTRQDGGPWSWWLSYAWSRVTDRIDGRDVPRSWDQRHALGAGLRYAGESWEFTVADSYHTGWPTTSLYLAPDTGGGPDVVTVGPRNAARFNAYNSLDLRVLRRFALPASTLETFFELTNALARRNVCCNEYDVETAGGEPVIDTDVDYWPRLIPSLGVTWKF